MNAKSTIKTMLCLAILLAMASTVAQQDPNRNFYRYNMNLVNPAFAGSHVETEGIDSRKGSELGINFRSQWAGVSGAPETQTAFFSTGLGKNVGFGVSILNDRTFIEQQTSLAIDVSYKLKVSEQTNLFFGVKAGATSYNANTSGLTTFGLTQDPSLLDLNGGFKPAIGAGVYLQGSSYFVTISIPNATTSERLEQRNGEVLLGDSRMHIYLSGGYDFQLGKGVIFKPSVLARYVDSAPLSIDVTGAFRLADRFELGATYRLDEGVAGMLLVDVANWVDIGYAYEMPINSPVVNSSNGTHEVFMKLKL